MEPRLMVKDEQLEVLMTSSITKHADGTNYSILKHSTAPFPLMKGKERNTITVITNMFKTQGKLSTK